MYLIAGLKILISRWVDLQTFPDNVKFGVEERTFNHTCAPTRSWNPWGDRRREGDSGMESSWWDGSYQCDGGMNEPSRSRDAARKAKDGDDALRERKRRES